MSVKAKPRILVPPAPPPLDITERQWDALVDDLARFLGWRSYHTHDSRRSEKGFPDRVYVRDRVIFLELKTERGRVKLEQVAWGEALVRAGAEYYLIRPSDWALVLDVLQREGVRGCPPNPLTS
jgi:hypothetical protein